MTIVVTSRRAVLGGFAGAAVLPAVGLTAPSGFNAALADYRAKKATFDLASEACSRADERYRAMRPELPPALLYRWRLHGGDGTEFVEELRSQRLIDHWMRPEFQPKRYAAACAALADYEAGIDRAAEESGANAADAALDDASDARDEAAERLLNYPIGSPAELAIKFEVYLAEFEPKPDANLARLASDAGALAVRP